jgi:signal transduction histidine kinase
METLNIASVCGEILITFINNALDGAKLEANKLELDYHMSDIVEVLSKAVSLYTWKSKEKKISIGLKIAKCMPEQVEIDEARLAQVLVNLIGNAVKFTPAHGNVKVRSRFLPDFGHVINSSQSGGSSSEACSEEQEALRKHFA